jgi:hypothetical protein
MAAAGTAQTVLAAIGMSSDTGGGALSMAFAGIWLLAAALFWNAAKRNAAAALRT